MQSVTLNGLLNYKDMMTLIKPCTGITHGIDGFKSVTMQCFKNQQGTGLIYGVFWKFTDKADTKPLVDALRGRGLSVIIKKRGLSASVLKPKK